MNELPEKYKCEMKTLLKDEYDDYLTSFESEHIASLRVNESKITVEEFLKRFPYPLKPVPWCHNGFYYDEKDPVTKHPYYYAGLFYIQEASAMLPAEVLPVEEGDKVLDLCAAPGGKSTELGVKLNGTGILFSNDISYSRAQALLKNLERFGIGNSFVLTEDPEKLENHFDHYFDKILIDAPCSGEGMFRKDHSLIKSWIEKDSSYYAPIQKELIASGLKMLKDGGQIVYSTCTFSPEEDEKIIEYALSLDPSLKVIPIRQSEGFVQNAYGTKLFPHRIKGEGHFVSLLQKGETRKTEKIISRSAINEIEGVYFETAYDSVYQKAGKNIYIAPETERRLLSGLRIMRSGILLGEVTRSGMKLSPYLAMYVKDTGYGNTIHLSVDDIRVTKYLKGETIDISDFDVKDGYVVVCVEEWPMGLAKISHKVFKNNYPKSWRMQ